MNSFLAMFNEYSLVVELSMTLMFFCGFVMFLVNYLKMKKLLGFYQQLFRGEDKNLEEIMAVFTDKCDRAVGDVEELRNKLLSVGRQTDNCLQKVSIYRFDAFPDMGGEMSFSLTLLNQENSGLIISNIYGRNESNVYVRNIKKGQADSYLLPEEEKSLAEAIAK